MKASTTENWRDVAGYEGVYRVSDLGRVRSLDRMVDGPIVQRKSNGKVISLSFVHRYQKVGLQQNGLRKQFLVHRLVAAAFIGPCPDGKQVNHLDGDKLNNQPSNLEYVTPSQNTLHAYETGLKKAIRGTEHHSSKLSEADVLEIRATYAAGGITQRKLADSFGVGHKQISKIILRQRWAHLPPA